jgi:hypothetical protein
VNETAPEIAARAARISLSFGQHMALTIEYLHTEDGRKRLGSSTRTQTRRSLVRLGLVDVDGYFTELGLAIKAQ